MSAHFLRSATRSIAAGACACVIALLFATCVAGTGPADARGAAAPDHVPAGLSITSPRLCAAVVVYRLASADDWGLRTTLAQTALNAFATAGGVPDCAAPVAEAMARDFDARRWQAALDAVDAVRSGDYRPAPAACARANAIVPINAEPLGAGAAAHAQCVISGLAFVEVQP